ncbi:MAG: Ig-like domain-containing protein, partial [bacterium]
DHDLNYYQNVFMGPGGVKEYYLDQSENKLTPNFTVSSQVYRMPKPLSQYGYVVCNPSQGGLILDAIQVSDVDIDYRNFDALIIIYAGAGDLWAFMCPSGSFPPVTSNDGATIYEFVEVSEADPAKTLDSSVQATVTHEFGHQLGMPDFYGYGWGGIGVWDIMSYGFSNATDKAFSFSAWCKAQLGWVIPQVKVGVDEDIALNSVESSPDVFIKAPVGGNPSSQEYFLIEYRTRTGVDAGLPGGGILIWHAKDDSPYDSNSAVPADPSTIRTLAPLLVEQADGREDLENDNNLGDAGDPFPGSAVNRTFDGTSTPNSNKRDGTTSGVEITNITETGGQGRFHLRVGAAPGVFTIRVTNPVNNSYATGTVAIAATIQGSQTIQYVDFFVDGTAISRDPTPPYSVNWDATSVLEGSHTITATALDLSGSTASDSVIVVVDRTPPQIQITSPVNGAFIGGPVTLTTTASDNNGVQRVDFFIDNTLKQTLTVPPFNFFLNTVQFQDGPHVLKVVAMDGAGLSQQAQVNVTTDNVAPIIAILTPAPGATISGSVPITHAVSDNLGVQFVELRIDGTLKAILTPPYSYLWDTTVVTGRNHVIQSIARDNAGNTAAATLNVIVKNDFTTPLIAFSIPPANAQVCGNVSAIVNATDDRGLLRVD